METLFASCEDPVHVVPAPEKSNADPEVVFTVKSFTKSAPVLMVRLIATGVPDVGSNVRELDIIAVFL
jgi:hypothetical protein